MEGDGMVAIVHGLKDACVAVTVVNSVRPQNAILPPGGPISPQVHKSSVETSTYVERSSRSTGVHDDRYTSSYQVAHCYAKPTSPPVLSSEFPPQRLEPLRNQGNFKVGEYCNEEYNFSPLQSQYYGGGQGSKGSMWPDRGVASGRLSPTCNSVQNMDPFMHSLRRYPMPISPERSISNELVQRLLNYTQNKHSSKNSNRTARTHDERTTKNVKSETSTKHVQTFARPLTKTREHGANTRNDVKFNVKKGRFFASGSPYLNSRTKSDHQSCNYDYLKANTARRGRHTEVRYLNDVKKVIRDTIKHIYNESNDVPRVCPQFKSRYNKHQKEHHPDAVSEKPGSEEEIVKAAQSTSFEKLCARCIPPTGVQFTSTEDEDCCICPKPKTCTRSKKIKIIHQISKWQKGLPVCADDSSENKKRREKAMKDLADSLINLEGDKDNEIKKCLEELPIWYPEDKQEQEEFRNKLADDLNNRLKVIEEEEEKYAGRRSSDRNKLSKESFEFKMHHRRSSLEGLNSYKDMIWQRLDDALGISEENKIKYKKKVDKFAKKLQKMHEDGIVDGIIEKEIHNFIKTISDTDSDSSVDKETQQLILDRISNLVDDNLPINISGSKRKESKNKIADIQAKNFDNLFDNPDDFVHEIEGVLMTEANMSKSEAVDLAAAIQAISKIKSNSSDEELVESIRNEISDLIDDIPANISKSKRKEIINEVANIQAKHIDSLYDNPEGVKHEIVNTLTKETNIPEKDASDLAYAMVSRVKGMPLPDKYRSSVVRRSLKTDEEIKQLISEDIHDVLNDYNISPKVKREVEKKTEEIANQVMRGTDEARDSIVSILKNVNISEDDALNVSNRLLELNQNRSRSYPTQNSRSGITHQSRSMSSLTRKRRKEAEGRLSKQDNTERKKRKFSEMATSSSFSRKAPSSLAKRSSVSNQRYVSTPKYPYQPSIGSLDVSSVRVDRTQSMIEEENEYRKQQMDIILQSLDELPINFNGTDDENFKENMAADLAEDIVDRQKYFQLNPDKTTSDQEELEHLKYQVFRWLNKLPGFDNMSSIMTDIETLLQRIKALKVPVLVKSSDQRIESKLITDGTTSFMLEQDSSQFVEENLLGALQDWIKSIPLFRNRTIISSENQELERLIAEMMKGLKSVFTVTQNLSAGDKDRLSKDELVKHLERFPMDLKLKSDSDFIKYVAEQMLQYLKDLQMFSSDLSGRDRKEDYLKNVLDEWINSLPINIMHDSEIVHYNRLVREFPEKLRKIRKEDPENEQMIKYEIRSYLLRFPIAECIKQDWRFINDKVETLYKYILAVPVETVLVHGPNLFVIKAVAKWLKSLPFGKGKTVDDIPNCVLDDLVSDISSIIVKMVMTEPGALENAIEEATAKFLTSVPLDPYADIDVKSLANALLQDMKDMSTHTPATKRCVYVESIAKTMPLSESSFKAKSQHVMETPSISKPSSLVTQSLIRVPLSIVEPQFSAPVLTKSQSMVKSDSTLKSPSLRKRISIGETSFIGNRISQSQSIVKEPHMRKSADFLFDNIQNWVNKLPLESSSERKEKLKQEIASKLLNKIGELNMNPEVFNDNLLYQDMLEDIIDNLLTELNSEEINAHMPALKTDLVLQLLEVKQMAQEEVAGSAYKQQLRDAISKTVPSEPTTTEEQASFDILKDNLADAFISLHYVGDNEKEKNKYKAKVAGELTKFCNSFLKNPCSQNDSKKLNQDLYNALKAVPFPKEETAMNEVELVKIKDEISDWIKEVPLKDKTAAGQMQRNKMVAVLAKKLHEVEKLKEHKTEYNCDDIIFNEITKWLRKLPEGIDEPIIKKLTEKLVNNLKNTMQSRKVSAATRNSIGPDAFYEFPCTFARPSTTYTIPPTTLSTAEQSHLQRIRERCSTERQRFRDASVSPQPVDTASQTEIPCEGYQSGGFRNLCQQSSGIQTQVPPCQRSMQAVGSQAEVSPHVIVKEYYWDPAGAAEMREGASSPSQFCTTNQFPCTEEGLSLQNRQGIPMMESHQRLDSYDVNQSLPPCPPCLPYTPKAPQTQSRRIRKEWEPPCHRRNIPEVVEDEEPCTSRYRDSGRRVRVTRLGSFDDIVPKCSRSRHDMKFLEEDDYWGDKRKFACVDRTLLKDNNADESREKAQCRCREKIFTKCSAKKRGKGCNPAPSNEEMKTCSKCCGVHCPYPSYLYFRQ